MQKQKNLQYGHKMTKHLEIIMDGHLINLL